MAACQRDARWGLAWSSSHKTSSLAVSCESCDGEICWRFAFNGGGRSGTRTDTSSSSSSSSSSSLRDRFLRCRRMSGHVVARWLHAMYPGAVSQLWPRENKLWPKRAGLNSHFYPLYTSFLSSRTNGVRLKPCWRVARTGGRSVGHASPGTMVHGRGRASVGAFSADLLAAAIPP